MNTNLKHHPGLSKAINHRSGLSSALRSKKTITLFALLLTLTLSSFTRHTGKTRDLANSSFQKEFRNARIIGRETFPNYTRFTFSMNDLVLSAIYSDKGELMAVTRNIRTDQLPFRLMLGIKENYKEYWVTGLFELSSKEENAYYATIENATLKLALRSVNNIDWEVYKKTKKN